MRPSSQWQLRLVRIEPARNRRRHWSVSREPTLFHPEGALVRCWGRIGSWTRTGCPRPLTPEAALAEAHRLIAAKLRRGYSVQACSWTGLLELPRADVHEPPGICNPCLARGHGTACWVKEPCGPCPASRHLCCLELPSQL